MNRLEFLLGRYDKEWERQSTLNDSLNMPVGIITGLSALVFFLVNEFTFSKGNSLTIIPFLFFLGLALIAWVKLVYHLFESYNSIFKGFLYATLPFPSELDKYYRSLVIYVNENKEDLEPNITADSMYEKYIEELLTESLDINIQNNDIKSGEIHLAKQSLFFCVFFLVLSLIPFGFNYAKNDKGNEVQEVIIKNIQEFTIIKPKEIMATKENSKPAPPPKAPSLRLIKEGQKPSTTVKAHKHGPTKKK